MRGAIAGARASNIWYRLIASPRSFPSNKSPIIVAETTGIAAIPIGEQL